MTLEEYKSKLNPVECEEIRSGLARVVPQGTEFYLVYDYDKLERKRKRDYAIRTNTPTFTDAESEQFVQHWME